MLAINSDNRVSLRGLRNADGRLVVGANVTVTVADKTGAIVGGPYAMVGDGNGNYFGVLDASLPLELNQLYEVTTVAVVGQSKKTWRSHEVAVYPDYSEYGYWTHGPYTRY